MVTAKKTRMLNCTSALLKSSFIVHIKGKRYLTLELYTIAKVFFNQGNIQEECRIILGDQSMKASLKARNIKYIVLISVSN